MLKRFSLRFDSIFGQFYVTPSLSVTYDVTLNGSYEVSIWWFNRVISVSYEP